ncbi:MAG: 4-alpha-glucanotransferase [Proteobacteria bacterium]|nr:4-alpha-glucanotransferase [Pseudomonadota bacterium]MBU1715229.1 4-alpha-glucanotransferase [Pseudomonadota bacterium]
MSFVRGSGILQHITSLSGDYGIGGIGNDAARFINFLADSGQRYWQFLPLGPGSDIFDNSPYMSLSAFAGNPLLIDPDLLIEEGFLGSGRMQASPAFSDYFVEFDKVIPFKNKIFAEAFENFKITKNRVAFEEFCHTQMWLADYSLFMALRDEFHLKAWYDWPLDLASRRIQALTVWRNQLAERIMYYDFVQFCFFTQWQRLRGYARGKGVSLIGDLPIYVGLDSADVWAHQDCFRLDPNDFRPTHVSGVPPDYFSDTGQRWGNPLYRWKNEDGTVNEMLYEWWRKRFQATFNTVDICRIDHFRGFESYWEIETDQETAINGRWVKGPGKDFFRAMFEDISEMPIIAEDLGIITSDVEKLRDELGFPGMKVLQFAFDSDAGNNYLPHNYKTSNCVVYTGTHDNDTSLGWYLEGASQQNRKRAAHYVNNHPGSRINWDLMKLAFSSIADVAIIPMQDVLGFGSDCRMNKPGTVNGNWRWRCAARFLSDQLKERLREETVFYGRA